MLAGSPDLSYSDDSFNQGRINRKITLTGQQKINACSYTYDVIAAANEWDIDPWKLFALIYVESTWSLDAVSTVGACGITQIVPKYHRDKYPGLTCENLHNDPRNAIHLAAAIIKQHHTRFNSYARAFEAYNAGPRRVIENTVPSRTIKYRNKIINLSVFLRQTYYHLLGE
jgi:soluble lytic murein transglycosylase-like protein